MLYYTKGYNRTPGIFPNRYEEDKMLAVLSKLQILLISVLVFETIVISVILREIIFIILSYASHLHLIYKEYILTTLNRWDMQQHTTIHFHMWEIPTCKMSVGKDRPECVDPAKQAGFHYNNAPLGVKVYCFISLTQQLELHFTRHTEHIL